MHSTLTLFVCDIAYGAIQEARSRAQERIQPKTHVVHTDTELRAMMHSVGVLADGEYRPISDEDLRKIGIDPADID